MKATAFFFCLMLCGCGESQDAKIARKSKNLEYAGSLLKKMDPVIAEISALKSRIKNMPPGGALELEMERLHDADKRFDFLMAEHDKAMKDE